MDYKGLPFDENNIYIIPISNDKPLKVVFEELPCPILLNLDIAHRCKHSKSKSEDLIWSLYCPEYEEHRRCIEDIF